MSIVENVITSVFPNLHVFKEVVFARLETMSIKMESAVIMITASYFTILNKIQTISLFVDVLLLLLIAMESLSIAKQTLIMILSIAEDVATTADQTLTVKQENANVMRATKTVMKTELIARFTLRMILKIVVIAGKIVVITKFVSIAIVNVKKNIKIVRLELMDVNQESTTIQ